MISLGEPSDNSVASDAADTRTRKVPEAITGHAGVAATEFRYKDEEIYGEDEPAEYVYQVISGAVRSYKLLADRRRQIGAFHLRGDVFGLELGARAPAGGGSHRQHHRASGENAAASNRPPVPMSKLHASSG